MKRLSLEQLDLQADLYNASVAASGGIDPFCSRTDWIIPFHQAFMPACDVFIWQAHDSFVALAGNVSPDGRMFLAPLEPLWRFPSPLVGPDAPDMLAALLQSNPPDPDLRGVHLIMFGLPDSPAFIQALIEKTAGYHHKPFLLEPTQRCTASLAGGVDGFLRRRTAKFRYNLRRALRKEQKQHITFRYITNVTEDAIAKIYAEILAIERTSWKGLSSQGTDQPPMKEFYHYMLQRIAPAGQLRLIIAVLENKPIGYIYGAVVGKHFRGLQFSFDQQHAGLSPGNFMQYRMIEWMCKEGCVQYDFGMLVPYKRRWAESIHTTRTVYLYPILKQSS